eukprot:9487157-Pyramimonas_sp.AAC.1
MRAHTRRRLEYDHRDGELARTVVDKLSYDNVLTEDRGLWEKALYSHGFAKYHCAAQGMRNVECIEERKRRRLQDTNTVDVSPISMSVLLQARSRLKC